MSLRPAPDTMAYLTALLPVEQGVAVYAALDAAAGTARATGDERGRGQVMADTLVERLTGQASAAAVPVEVQLVMPAETLLDGGEEPAHVPGHGPMPAAFARRLLSECTDAGAAGWLRRLFDAPGSGQLVAMDARRRRFDGGLRRFIVARDQVCRTPVVQRADPACRPHGPQSRWRTNQRGQRARDVRGVQLREGGPRVASRRPLHRSLALRPRRSATPDQDHHADGAHLRLHSATAGAQPIGAAER